MIFCFCDDDDDDDDSFSYNGFTFFRYLRRTSLARFMEDPAGKLLFSGSRTLWSLARKTDESFLDREEYLLGFLWWWW